MSWKNVFVGAMVTLVVSVIAGVIVFFLTDKGRDQEKLVFRIEKGGIFRAPDMNLSILNVDVENIGGHTAKTVKIKIDNFKDNDFRNIAINSITSINNCTQENSPPPVLITCENMPPTDKVRISLLTQGTSNDLPTVAVRSDMTVGRERVDEERKNSPITPIASITITIFALILQITAVSILRPKFIRRFSPTRLQRHPNNSAFILLHKGFWEDSGRILEETSRTRGIDAIELSNYGTALFLHTRDEKYEKLLDAAEWWAKTNREKLIVLLNRSIVLFYRGKILDSVEALKKSLSIDKGEIIYYSKMSDIIKDMRLQSSDIDKIFPD